MLIKNVLSKFNINTIENSVKQLETKFPTEFNDLQKCLNDRDYRFGDCRKTEQALVTAWNAQPK